MAPSSHNGEVRHDPLVLIHGFSGTWRVWEPMMERLDGSRAVVPIALAGHVGGVPFPAGSKASVETLVSVAERHLDEAGIETGHIVGNSLGGWVALELARRGRARSVIALAPAGGWLAGTREERRLRALFTRMHRSSSLLEPFAPKLMARPRLRRALLMQAVAYGDRLPPALALSLVRDALETPAYFDLMTGIMEEGPPQGLDGIECPALLVWGTRDQILPMRRYSARMRELVPSAEWLELPKLGHMPMCDDPEQVARIVTDFATRAEQMAPALA